MSRILLNTRIWLLMLLFGIVSSVYAQDDDFTTWTKFKVNAARKSKVDDNTARMQSIKQLGV